MLSDFGFCKAYGLSQEQQPWRLRGPWGSQHSHIPSESGPPGLTDMTRRDCGTTGYMAPEVCRGDWYTYSADVFSLGVVFFEIMNGKVRIRSLK